MSKFYLYRHVRNDNNVPFYIGIGTKHNKYASYCPEYMRAFDFRRRNTFWKNVANKTPIDVEILYESDSHEEIKTKEIEFIALYGRSNRNNGPLVNLTDGGDTTTGLIRSGESKLKTSNTLKGHKVSEETRKKFSLIRKGAKLTLNQRLKLSESLKGRKVSAETKLKISIKLKGRVFSDETLQKMSKSHVGKSLSKEQRRKIGEASKKNWDKAKSKGTRIHSSETRKKISEAGKGRVVSLETRKKISIARRKYLSK